MDSDLPVGGVATNSKVNGLGEVVMAGIDLALEEHLRECMGACADCYCRHQQDADSVGSCTCPGEEPHQYNPTGDHELCAPQGRTATLIGSWKKSEDGKYEPDENGEYSAIVGELHTQVVWSKHTTRGAPCSPCFPGQVDLETPGQFLAFDLPPAVWDKER